MEMQAGRYLERNEKKCTEKPGDLGARVANER